MIEGIKSTDSRNNSALYTAGGAVIGGGAAATYGYMSKPYVKNLLATDGFADSFFSNLKKEYPVESNSIETIATKLKNINSIDELKGFTKAQLLEGLHLDTMTPEQFGGFKTFILGKAEENLGPVIKKVEIPMVSNILKILENIEDPKEFKVAAEQIIDGLIDNINIDSFKKGIKDLEEHLPLLKKSISSGILYGYMTDPGSLDNSSKLAKAVKSAMKSVQFKTAGIFGVIGAGIAGVGTYLATACKKPQEAPVEGEPKQA